MLSSFKPVVRKRNTKAGFIWVLKLLKPFAFFDCIVQLWGFNPKTNLKFRVWMTGESHAQSDKAGTLAGLHLALDFSGREGFRAEEPIGFHAGV
jgi:hypothetical protein